MSACDASVAEASLGVSSALRAVDCLAGETTATAFGRLFGSGGALLPALTVLLTLYIAFFAVSLLTGRSRLGISALTPRMLALGLVLTFATSWVAYQSVLWNLAVGAPDEIASVITGSQGSATKIFADRIDVVFSAIGEAASSGQPTVAEGAEQAAAAAPKAATGSFTPGNLMWLSALLLLLGTVGVLVTARIALAVLLAVGPVFLILALFPGTRGLTAGWLRGLVLTAITPLFVVLGGGIMIELLVPVVQVLAGPDGINGRAALALFLIASVHLALMMMVMKVAGTMVSGWQVFGLAGSRGAREDRGPVAPPALPASGLPAPLASIALTNTRRAAFVIPPNTEIAQAGSVNAPGGASVSRTQITQLTGDSSASLPNLPRQRARGIGSRFSPPVPLKERIR